MWLVQQGNKSRKRRKPVSSKADTSRSTPSRTAESGTSGQSKEEDRKEPVAVEEENKAEGDSGTVDVMAPCRSVHSLVHLLLAPSRSVHLFLSASNTRTVDPTSDTKCCSTNK